ncbi:hypothetical protein [Erythrobacter sp. JK5]|uniref:hypothetical protein n=1 Tax=Erythrobacter sp. JK5 TaxID=2829500 RepID=UPI001BA80BBE|nr:hypothetical protein [Erythrobacter sp. JK5]QUL37795.1 hypothetical protein KDC96_15910 [Erythrobacter sp. JK5]
MNRFAFAAALALGLSLAGCRNEPEEGEAGSSEDSIAPVAPQTAGGDEIVSEGPTDDATPYTGTTGGSGGSSSARGRSGSNASAASSPGSDTMQSGSNPDGARPPKGSKLLKADPQ